MFSLLRMFGFLLFHFKYERFKNKYFSYIKIYQKKANMESLPRLSIKAKQSTTSIGATAPHGRG